MLLSSTACVTSTPNLKGQTSPTAALASSDKSIVFGRIQWLEHGKEKEIGKGLFAFSVTPHLLRLEDKAKLKSDVDAHGEFVWTLTPGIYVVSKIAYRDPWSGNYFMVPQVAFRVPEKGKVYYIGTLKVDFASERDLIGGLSGQVSVQILDDAAKSYDTAAEDLRIRPALIEKSLMVHASGLPKTIDTTEEFNLTAHILNAIFFGLSH